MNTMTDSVTTAMIDSMSDNTINCMIDPMTDLKLMTDPMTDLMTEIMSDKNCCVRTVSHSCTVFLLEIEFCAKVEWKECRSIICLYYTQSRGVSKYNNAS